MTIEVNIKNVDPDRREIVAMIDKIQKYFGMSYQAIVNVLENEDINPNYFTRMKDNRQAPKNDGMGKIKYSEMLVLFKEKFGDHLIKIKKIEAIDTDLEQIAKTHADYFIYYYESFQVNTSSFYPKFALIGFDIEMNSKGWSKGTIYYFTKNVISKIFKIKRLRPKPENPRTLFFYASLYEQINFYTIKIDNRTSNSWNFLPLTYSVLETQLGLPCAGKGILERVENGDYKKKIKELIDNKKGIDNRIINFLYLKKYVLDELVPDESQGFLNPQTQILKGFTGIWSGIYLRHDIEKGCLCYYALYLSGSGKCEMHYMLPDEKIKHCYYGFVEFPFNDKGIMKISLEYSKDVRTHRIEIILSKLKGDTKKLKYAGIISGWAQHDKKIYSSTIYLERNKKIDKTLSNEEIITEVNLLSPNRITKKLINESLLKNANWAEVLEELKINPEYLDALKILENKYFATFENCMPHDM